MDIKFNLRDHLDVPMVADSRDISLKMRLRDYVNMTMRADVRQLFPMHLWEYILAPMIITGLPYDSIIKGTGVGLVISADDGAQIIISGIDIIGIMDPQTLGTFDPLLLGDFAIE